MVRLTRRIVVASAAVSLLSCRPSSRVAVTQGDSASISRDRWRPVLLRDSDRTSLDTRTVLRTDSFTYRVWLRTVFSLPQTGVATTTYRPWKMSIQRNDFDCRGLRVRFHQTVYYDSSGTDLGTSQPDEVTWQDLVPGSVGEGLADSVCAQSQRLHLGVSQDST
jgi:hypothetical protein